MLIKDAADDELGILPGRSPPGRVGEAVAILFG